MKRAGILVLWAALSLIASAAFAADAAPKTNALRCKELPQVRNVYWTTPYGPARADVVTAATNMLPCSGPTYALCFYSGPSPMTCKVDKTKHVANCQCTGYNDPSQSYKYFVDINGILNTCVYIETVGVCGSDGSKCQTENSAPVCQYINQHPQALMPKAQLISTFSTAQVKDHPPGCTQCQGRYAGCMTAPCFLGKNSQGFAAVYCECPLYDGPYQVGQGGASCNLGEGLVWSAAYNPAGCPSAGSQ